MIKKVKKAKPKILQIEIPFYSRGGIWNTRRASRGFGTNAIKRRYPSSGQDWR